MRTKPPPAGRALRAASFSLAATLLRIAHPAAAAAALIGSIGAASPLLATTQDDHEHPYSVHVEQASLRFGIPENWIWAVMRQESGGNPRATSPVGAQGLMQIMPGTWAMLTARYGLGANAYDVRANIMAGAAYLRMMWDRYRDIRLMLAAYNAGPGRADAYASRRRGLPSETVNYVARIAPVLGTSGIASPAIMPSPNEPSWRSAAVFTAREEGASPDDRPATNAHLSRASSAPQTASGPADPPSTNALFFPIKGGGQ